MARKKAEPAEPTQQERVTKLTPEKTLTDLIKTKKRTGSKVDELVAEYRSALSKAVEKKHLHKKAFAAAAKLHDMEDTALGEFFDHFDHYCDVLGIRDRAENAPRLDLGDQPGEGPEEDEDQEPSNVTKLQPGAAVG